MVAGVSGVNGSIYRYDGAPVVGAGVYGGYVDGDVKAYGSWHYSPMVTTDAAGAYTLSDLTASTNGLVDTSYKEAGEWRGICLYPLVFADASTSIIDVRPGRVGWQASRGGPWDEWRWPQVLLISAEGGYASTGYTFDKQGSESGSAEGVPGSVTWAQMAFWWNEADEWFAPDPVMVTAGADAGTAISFDESDAVRSTVSSPYWRSCSPGTTVKLKLHDWPAGYEVAFDGWEDSPRGNSTTFGGKTWTSPGARGSVVSLRIPSTTEPGYGYVISPRRTDEALSELYLREYIQIATLNKASASGGVRLSGIVPTKGHWGSEAGIRKRVVIWAKNTKSGIPTKWNPALQGWRGVTTVRCDGYGVFKTGVLRPTRNTWYVACYGGDDWYWGAFTNVVSVLR